MPPPTPPPVNLPRLPAGWVPGTNLTPAVVSIAREVLRLGRDEYGAGDVREVEGRVFAFRREPHFDNHPLLKPGQRPSDPGAPEPYWHPGISVWERIDPKALLPKELIDLLPKKPTFDALTLLTLAVAGTVAVFAWRRFA